MPFMHEDLNGRKNQKTIRRKIDTLSSDLKIENDLKQKKISKDLPKPPQDKSSNDEIGTELISWEAPEYFIHKKGFLWYFVLVLLTGALIFVSFKFKQWILIGVIFSSFLIVIQYSLKKPKIKKFTLGEKGIRAGGRVYYYSQFSSFWIKEERFGKEETKASLNLLPIKKFLPVVVIPIERENDSKIIKTKLNKYLPESAKKIDIIDQLMNKIKF